MKYEKQKRWEERNKEKMRKHRKAYRQTEEYKILARERQKEYRLKNIDKVKEKQPIYQKGYVATLSDSYLLTLMCVKKPHLRQIFKQHPEIIECERARLFLKREIKQREHKKTPFPGQLPSSSPPSLGVN